MTIKAQDVHNHMRTVAEWVDWQRTCDGFKYGDPEAPVRGIAVAWQSLQSALEEAHQKGCNLFVTHEPTFYSHMDDDGALLATEPARRKSAFLDRTGMVVYRCHDAWDIFPELGIVDAWSQFLGLGQPLTKAKYYNLHQVPRTTAWELTNRIARRVSGLGQQAVQLVGNKWQTVNRLAVGTGAITQVRRMVELGADVVLASDDGTTLWRDAAWMQDLQVPLLLVNHMTSEISGLLRLADYLEERFPGVPVHFVGPTCTYEISATQQYQDISIRMRRDDLDELPEVPLPEGYRVSQAKPDESWAYLQVMNRSNYAGEAGDDWYKNTFSSDPEYDPSFLQLIWKGDRPVAAAAAWHRLVDGERWGVLHWVGVDNGERGRGLGKAVSLAALHRLRERGFQRAVLTTGDWRLAAVAAYMRLGFRPWPSETGTEQVWKRVLEDLASWRRWGRRPYWEESTLD